MFVRIVCAVTLELVLKEMAVSSMMKIVTLFKAELCTAKKNLF